MAVVIVKHMETATRKTKPWKKQQNNTELLNFRFTVAIYLLMILWQLKVNNYVDFFFLKLKKQFLKIFSVVVFWPCSEIRQTQKLRTCLLRTLSSVFLPLKPGDGVGQNIACMLCLLLGSVSYHWSLHFPHIRVLPTQKVSTATPLENSLLSKVLSFKPWVGQKSSVVPQGSRSKGINDD